MEKTLVLIKCDGVQRGLIGAVIGKFEQAGLKVIGLKLVQPDGKLAEKQYPEGPQWKATWERTKKAYDEKGLEFKETVEQLTARLRKGLIDYLAAGPVAAMVLEGNEAIANVRKMVGATSPTRADPSSIRGMYTTDSYELADKSKRSVKNIIHASDSVESADKEIALWFSKKELIEYKRTDEDALYRL